MELETRIIRGRDELLSTIEEMACDGWAVHALMDVSRPIRQHISGKVWSTQCNLNATYDIDERYIVTFYHR